MFAIIGLLFVVMLLAVLHMLYKNEVISNKKALPRAKAEEYWNGKERRKFARFKKALEVTYVVRKKPHSNHNHAGCSVDISEGGMRLLLDDKSGELSITDGGIKLLLDEKFARGTIIDLRVTVPGSNKSAEIEGEVVWSEDAKQNDLSGRRFFWLGLKFSAIKEPHGKFLINYIQSLASDPETEKV